LTSVAWIDPCCATKSIWGAWGRISPRHGAGLLRKTKRVSAVSKKAALWWSAAFRHFHACPLGFSGSQ